MNSISIQIRILIPALVLVVSGISACATNPVSGRKEFTMMTEAQEIRLGKINDPRIRKRFGVYKNPKLQAYLNTIGQRLAARSHRPKLKYHFTILDTPTVNAFALPGGYIYVTRGLLAYMNSEAELAGVVGHELGHVTARHSVRQYTTAVSTSIGFSIFLSRVTGLQNQAGRTLMDVLGNAILSGYGRKHELEADGLGAEYLARSGYEPGAMLTVIGVLKNQEEFEKQRAKAEGRAPRIYHGVFASHPSADKRLQQVVTKANQYKQVSRGKTARRPFLQAIDGLTFGDSEKQGIRRGHRFYHKPLAFAIEFPKGWHIENTRRALIATNRQQNGILQMSRSPLKKKQLTLGSLAYLRKRFSKYDISGGMELSGLPLDAATGIARMRSRFGHKATRVTVIKYNKAFYILLGTSKNKTTFRRHDPLFLAAARSFHRLKAKEQKLAKALKIRIIRARQGDSFASLARQSPVPNYSETILRLINGKYPAGEPKAGEYIKIIQ